MNIEIGTDRKIKRIIREAAQVDPLIVDYLAPTMFSAAVNGLVSNCWDVVSHPYPDNAELRYKNFMTVYLDGIQAEMVLHDQTMGDRITKCNILAMALIAPYLTYFVAHSFMHSYGDTFPHPDFCTGKAETGTFSRAA